MAASAEAPSLPMLLLAILQARGGMGTVREKVCQWALTQKRTLSGGGALEDGDHSLLEDGGKRGGALGPDVVAIEAAKHGGGWDGERQGVSMGADTKANALVRERPAYSSDCSVELPLRPSARAAAPLGPSSLSCRLRAWWRQVVRHVKGR